MDETIHPGFKVSSCFLLTFGQVANVVLSPVVTSAYDILKWPLVCSTSLHKGSWQKVGLF